MTWEGWVALGLGVAAVVLSGKLVVLLREVKEFFEVVVMALEDGQVTTMEMAAIIKEAGDVKTATMDIVKAVQRR